MIQIFSDGKSVGSIEDAPRCIAEANSSQKPLEFRTSVGELMGRFVPAEKLHPVPWDPTVTEDELERQYTERKGMTLDEFWKRKGVK